jgi:hypothetical protein
LDQGEQKIARHFDAIGYLGSTEVIGGPDIEARIARLDYHLKRGTELASACEKAQEAIRLVEDRIAELSAG